MRRASELNGLGCAVEGLSWGPSPPEKEPSHGFPDIILGADVFYDTRDFEDVLATVRWLLERPGGGGGGVFITAYQHRSAHRSLEFLLAKWGLRCRHVASAASFLPADKAEGAGGGGGGVDVAEIVIAQ